MSTDLLEDESVADADVFDENSEASEVLNVATETQLERVWNRVRNYGITIGGYNLVLPDGLYSEVLMEPAIAPLPNSPSHFLGLTNLRGNLVPVYRLEPWLGQTCAFVAPRYAMLVDEWVRGAALVVENKPQVLNLADYEVLGDIPDDVPDALKPVVVKVYRSAEQCWYLINPQELFARLASAA